MRGVMNKITNMTTITVVSGWEERAWILGEAPLRCKVYRKSIFFLFYNWRGSSPSGSNIVASIGPPCEIWQIELDLIPPLVQPHGHSADEWLHPCRRLVVRGSKSPSDILVIQDLNFEGEVFFELNGWRDTFLMIITKKGSLMPSVSFYCWGQVMKAVVTLVPMISKTDDWMSWSVILLMCPLWTRLEDVYFACPRSAEVCYQYCTGLTETLIDRCFWIFVKLLSY